MIRTLQKTILTAVIIFGCTAAQLFAQADYYWTGASTTSTNWSDAANWLAVPIITDPTQVSVPAIPATAPTAIDNVHFNSSSFSSLGQKIVTIDAGATCADLTWKDITDLVKIDGSGPLTINGNYLVNGNINNQFSGTVIFAGTGSISTNIDFSNLVQITGNRTLASNITLRSLLITSGTLNDGGFTITGNAAGTLSMAGGTTLNISTSFPTAFTKTNISLATSSNIIYNGTTAQIVSDIPDYGNLIISGSNVKTLAGTTIVNGDLTILGSTLNANGKEIKLTGNWISNSGTFVHGNNLVTFEGTASSISTNDKFYNLTINKTTNPATVSLSSPISIDNNLTISSGKLIDGGNLITGNTLGTTTMTMSATSELILTSSPAAPNATALAPSPMPQFGIYNFSATSSVTYGGGTQSVRGMALAPNTGYGNLIIEGNGTKTLYYKDGTTATRGDTKIQGNLTIKSGSTLVDAGWTISGPSATSTKTLTIEPNGALTLMDSGSPMPVFQTYNFSTSSVPTSTVTYGGTTQNVAALPYGNLVISGNGTKTLLNTTSVANNLTITTGATLEDAGKTLSGAGSTKGTLTMLGTAILKLSNSAAASNTATVSPMPEFASYDLTATSTVNYAAGAAQRIRAIVSKTTAPISTGYGNLTISGSNTKTLNGDITIQGNLDIQAGTLASNNKNIDIQGNWISNNGTFNAGTGTVTFSGSTNTEITTSSSFYKLVINKTFSSNTITQKTPVTVTNNITFIKGMLVNRPVIVAGVSPMPSPNKLILTYDATATGASDNSFVDGSVEKSTNKQAFVFPIGEIGWGYRPMAIVDPGDVTQMGTYYHRNPTVDKYNVESVSTVIPSNKSSIQQPLAGAVSKAEYWTLQSIAGPQNAKVQLSWEKPASLYNDDPNYLGWYMRLVVASYRFGNQPNTGVWDNKGGISHTGNNDAGTVDASEAINNNLSIFTFGSVFDALPIELVYFKATLVEKEVVLDWATAKEINNDYFTIEKSKDGKNFTELTTVNGQGNSMQITKYTSVDYMPYNGVIYYRLKQTDMDGTYSYSKVVSVQTSVAESNALQVYQSASKQLQVSYVISAEENGVLTIHDSRGVQVWAKGVSGSGVQTEEQVNLQSAASGMYIVSLQMPCGKVVKKVIIY